MKLACEMDAKNGNQHPEKKQENYVTVRTPQGKGYRKMITITVIVVVSFVVVACVVLAAVYFGMKLTGEHTKETWVSFTDGDGAGVNEKITVTTTEEDYETETVRIIYDFDSMLVVYKFAGLDVCYVTIMNETTIDPPSKLYSNLTETKWNTTSDPIKYKFFQATKNEMPLQMLSPRARDMCKFNQVFWMVQQTEEDQSRNGIVKRLASTSVSGFSCCCTCGSCCRCQDTLFMAA